MRPTRGGRGIVHSALAVLTAVVVAGCATADIDGDLAGSNRDAASFTDGRLNLARTAQARQANLRAVDTLLERPVSQADTVRIALLNSPALQALLADYWADASRTSQTGRPPNPLLSFERLRFGDELEIGRLLSFGLIDLVIWPSRAAAARRVLVGQRLLLTGAVVDQVTDVRQAWVSAVAAQEDLRYARQVLRSAEAGAELARRMQAAGNFNRLDRARQQAFYAEAVAQLAMTQHRSVAARESLVRMLGLDDRQSITMTLPERLPDLPKEPRQPADVSRTLNTQRLDVRIAKAALDEAAGEQRLGLVGTLTDIELGLRRDTVFDDGTGARGTRRGFEVDVRLPLFDWGDARRDAMNARTLAAANRLEATVRAAASSARESYSAYRTAYDIARHFRDEVVPLRQLISEENVLRYNGMLIGVFDLLADSRAQIAGVQGALEASRQFWQADALLQAATIGRPVQPMPTAVRAAAAAAPAH